MTTFLETIIDESEVDFDSVAEEETESPEGYFAYDTTEKENRETANRILESLNSGNEWAWCTVKVTATWGEYEGTSYLGACSYKNREDFMKDDYYEGMKQEALEDLNRKIRSEVQS